MITRDLMMRSRTSVLPPRRGRRVHPRANTLTADGSFPHNTSGGQLSVGQAGAPAASSAWSRPLRQLNRPRRSSPRCSCCASGGRSITHSSGRRWRPRTSRSTYPGNVPYAAKMGAPRSCARAAGAPADHFPADDRRAGQTHLPTGTDPAPVRPEPRYARRPLPQHARRLRRQP